MAAPRSTPGTERPDPLPSRTVEADDDGGPAEGLLEAGGDDADDAGMPAGTGSPDEGSVDAAGRGLVEGGGEHAGLDVLALGVEAVEALGEGGGLVGVGGGEQPRPEVGGADAPAGVDPRPEGEAERPGARRAGDPGDARQRDEAGAAALGHDPQALAHECTVEAGERRDVGDGGERHEVEEAEEVGAGDAVGAHQAVDGDEEEKDHAGGAEIAEIAGLVLAVGVHHGEGRRQGLGADVVVEDDDVAAGRGDRLVAERAAVDADDEVVALPEHPHRRHVGTVAFLDAVGDVERRANARGRAASRGAAPPRRRRRRRSRRRPRCARDAGPPARSGPRPGPCRGATRDRASGRGARARGRRPRPPDRRRGGRARGRRSPRRLPPGRSPGPCGRSRGRGRASAGRSPRPRRRGRRGIRAWAE